MVDTVPLLSRREFIGSVVKLAVAGALVPGTLSQVLPAVAPDAFGAGGKGPVVKRDPTTNAPIPVTLQQLDGEPPIVFTAEWNFLPAVVYKVKRAILEGSTRRRGYNTAQFAVQHPTEPDHAILVYEGKCKHLGCTIGWDTTLPASNDVPDYNEDGTNDGRVLCPCHQGQYDVYDLAVNIPGTPPPAPLNVIEFDVRGYTDEATGTAYANAIMGEGKHQQNGYKEAAGKGAITIDPKAFALRTPGWSQ